ncbi:MAG: DUF4845 domain-containing protein [Gammaproteobacteria bacterium]
MRASDKVHQGGRGEHVVLGRQRGVSLSGLIVVLALLGLIAVVAMKVFPTVMEYQAIKRAIVAAKATNGTVSEVRRAFDKNAEVSMVTSITGKELIVSTERGQPEVAFRYEKRIPLVANVSLLIEYAGTTDKSGVVPDKTEAPQ